MSVTQINSRLVKDGSIDTADLKNGIITLAKMAWASAKGDLLVFDGSAYQRIPVGSDGKVLEADSSNANGVAWKTPANAGSNWSYQTADASLPVNPTAATTYFTQAVGANEKWRFRAVIFGKRTSGAGAANFSVAIPTGATMRATAAGQTTGSATYQFNPITASGTETTVSYWAITGVDLVIQIEGVVEVGANAGNIDIKARSAASNAHTLYQDSFCAFDRIA